MKQLIEMINKQLNNLNINREMVDKLNKFFMALNDHNKGNDNTLIKVMPTCRNFLVISNILCDNMELLETDIFKLLLIEFVNGFDNEMLMDVLFMLSSYGIIEISHDIKLLLFDRLYNSGYFCYVAVDSKAFMDNYEHMAMDLNVIANIVDNDSLNDIDSDLTAILCELYGFDNVSLKDVLL